MMWLLLIGLAHAELWDEVEARRATPESFALLPARDRYDLAMIARDVVRHAPTGRIPKAVARRAARLGWALTEADGIVMLAEAGDHRGQGLLAVRLGPLARDLVVQAPHPWFDLNTGRIACRMFEAGAEIRAVVVATVHRKATAHADAAHSPEQGFQAITQGVVDALAAPFVVQIHGYGKTSDAEAVVSAGSTWMRPTAFAAVKTAVAEALGLTDVRTGEEVPELAAKTNAQGRLIAGRARFLHLELGREARDRLLADEALRDALARALHDAAGAP